MTENQINYLYVKPGFSHLGFSIVATFLILTFYQATLFLGTFLINNNPDYSDFLPLVVGGNSLLFLLAPTLIAARLSPIPFKEIFRLTRPNLDLLLLSLLGIITFQIFVVGYSALQESLIPESLREFYEYFTQSIRNLYESILGGSSYLDYFKGFIIGAMIPAISEEALFRGFFQRSLEEKLKPIWAILISGITFGIIHMNPIDLVPLILIGIYLSLVAYHTGSIWVPIAAHFLNNFWALNVMYFIPLKDLEEQSRTIPVHFSLSLLIIGALTTIIILYFIIKLSRKNKMELEIFQ
ncbi:MAG: CPBP family intramembrane metalloprotease [Candidatus Kapabacteria bacterium]|nr:CPBP family intramembrane metalloprotease [Candidatus Kapabacteria bacterium]